MCVNNTGEQEDYIYMICPRAKLEERKNKTGGGRDESGQKIATDRRILLRTRFIKKGRGGEGEGEREKERLKERSKRERKGDIER